jgi:hypothetical protein
MRRAAWLLCGLALAGAAGAGEGAGAAGDGYQFPGDPGLVDETERGPCLAGARIALISDATLEGCEALVTKIDEGGTDGSTG